MGKSINDHRIKRFLSEIGIDPSIGFQRLAYSSNTNPDRSLFFVGDQAIIKAYGRSALEAYKLERDLGLIFRNEGVWSPHVIGYRSFDDEAYLAIQFVPGVVLNEVYQGMSLDAYGDLLKGLGQAMQSFHAIGLEEMGEIPFRAGVFPI